MKRVIVFLFFAAIGFSGFSQPNSQQILDRVRAHYQQLTGFSTNFTFEIDMPESENQVMKGKLYLKGDKYRLIMEDEEIISDDITLWYWMKKVKEVQVSYVDENEDILSPSDIFSIYLTDFDTQQMSAIAHQGRNVTLFELIPRDKSKPYFKIKVVINTGNDQLEQMQLFYKDGVVYTFTVKGEQEESLNDAFFTFSAQSHTDVQIIDLR